MKLLKKVEILNFFIVMYHLQNSFEGFSSLLLLLLLFEQPFQSKPIKFLQTHSAVGSRHYSRAIKTHCCCWLAGFAGRLNGITVRGFCDIS